MATEVENASSAMDKLSVNDVNGVHDETENLQADDNEWGFLLDDLYRLAVLFYKEKEGKAIHLSYKDKLRLVALTKQVSYGKYCPDVSPDVGLLDVVGNDRRQAWQTLADMGREDAMQEFVRYLDSLCPLLRPYIEAHRAEKEEQERRRLEEEQRVRKEEEEKERLKMEDEARQQQEEYRQKQLQQELQIRAALNQQTAIQFRQYAEQQSPGNVEQQDILIAQLQEQHYQQYMQQVYQQQLLHQQQQFQQLQAMSGDGENLGTPVPTSVPVVSSADMPQTNGTEPLHQSKSHALNNGIEGQHYSRPQEDEAENDQNEKVPLGAASMWTRKDLKEFRNSLRNEKDSMIKVGSGETVTVRVPTHEDGTCLFWEFATDSYDLGFGVYFEWTIAPSNQVSVQVSESSDEEELEEEEAGEGKPGDVEKGSSKRDNQPAIDEIIPVYRRDCHEEVYCGSHMYPGRGVYLLKFDNSYSLWRSKTLYYRVYYTR